jgi:hypothetical protein
MRNGIDLDYTKALNLFAQLGEKWLEGSKHSEREKIRELWASCLDYEKLESSEALNDWREYEEFRRLNRLFEEDRGPAPEWPSETRRGLRPDKPLRHP